LIFQTIYSEIKRQVTGSSVRVSDVKSLGFPMEVSEPLSDEDVISSLRSIIEMANEPFMEAQLEASRMLCDLSQHEDMQQALRESGGIEVLVRLMDHGVEWSRQHAVLALANLSSAQCCQVIISLRSLCFIFK